MKKLITLAFAILVASIELCLAAQPKVKLHNKPFGWAVCTSLTSGDDYKLTGGGHGKKIVLKSNGGDMREAIENAVKEYDVIVLDGSNGEFELYRSIYFDKICNKTIVGINGAVLKTHFFISPEMRQILIDANLKQYAEKAGTGGRLSNGAKVSEQREMMTRQLIINYTSDQKESYRESGIFCFTHSENIILRNLALMGPGSIDFGADDLLSITRESKHFWVDHCSFTDGMDGNCDITARADFVTMSWCLFQYTERCWDHGYSNLIAGSDSENEGVDKLNVTFYGCQWGKGIRSRTPMARFGTIHELNCYFNCPGRGDRVNPRKESEFLIENCYFVEGMPKPVVKVKEAWYIAKSWNLKGNIFKTECDLQDEGQVFIPYKYNAFPAELVPEIVSANVGPVLKNPLKF